MRENTEAKTTKKQRSMCDRYTVSAIILFNVIVTVSAMAYGEIVHHQPDRYFAESRFITWISFFQLLSIGALAIGIYLRRKKDVRTFFSQAVVWLLGGVGFFFLAVDEKYKLHEQFDKELHKVMGMTETARSDRIDDFIILGYGVLGAIVLWYTRREVLRFRGALKYIFIGFFFLVVMVVLDASSNTTDLVEALGFDQNAKRITDWLGALEDIFKLVAEGFFLAGFFLMYRSTKK